MRALAIGFLLIASVGCQPGVVDATGDDDGSSGGSSSTGDSESESGSGSSTGVTDASSSDGSSSTGEPGEVEYCWESSWARADGVDELWTDGTRALAAADLHLLRFDGGAWSEHAVGFPVTDVAASAVDDAWVAGWSRLAHFDGESFTELALPAEFESIESIASDGAGLLWLAARAICEIHIGPGCELEPALVFTWDGEAWTERESPGAVRTLVHRAGALWAGGESGLLARFEGSTWSVLPEPSSGALVHVFPLGDDEVWAAGSGALMHWVDGAWTTTDVGFVTETVAFASTGASLFRLDETFDSDSIDRIGTLWRLDGETWTQLASATAQRTMIALDDGSLLLGGRNAGHVVERVEATGDVEVVYSRGTLGAMTALWGTTLENAMGVDATGLQVRRDGGWVRTQLPDTGIGSFVDITGFGDGDGFAVRNENPNEIASVWRIDDGELVAADPSLPEPWYRQLWGDGNGRVFLAGSMNHPVSAALDLPILLQWDGAGWANVFPVDNYDVVVGVHGVDGNLYAITPTSMRHFDGEAWNHFFAPEDHLLSRVRAWSTEAVFAIVEPPSAGEPELRKLTGTGWTPADATWAELDAVVAWRGLTGDAEVGIWAWGEAEDGTMLMWRFDGEAFAAFELPVELAAAGDARWLPTADGFWADDGLRLWRADPC